MFLSFVGRTLLCLTFLCTVSYTATAQVTWAGQAGGTGSDQAGDVALDIDENVFITGNFTGDADFDNDGVMDDASSTGGEDIFLAKYDNTGALVWVISAGGSGSDEGFAVDVDASGAAYVAGYFSGGADFDGDDVDDAIAVSARDLFLAKYDASGAFQWVRTAGGLTGNGQDAGTDVDVDGTNVFLTGYFRGDADFDNDGIADIINSGQQDAFAARYDLSGALSWVSAIGGGQADEGSGIVSDGSGGALITGFFKGSIDIDGDAVFDLVSVGGDDAFLVSCDGSGAMNWANAGGGADSDQGKHIGRDVVSGDIYITGTFKGSADFDGDTIPDLVATGASDLYLVKYNSTGSMQWAVSASGSSNERPERMVVESGAFITGGYQGTIDFNNDGIPESTSSSGDDVFVVEYNPDGSYRGSIVASGNGDDWGTGIVVDNDLNMYVVGTFMNELDILDNGFDDLTTNGSHDVFLFCAARVIPVELVSFGVTANGANVILQWETASETNNAGFEVFMRRDGDNYVAIGFVDGHGTTTEVQTYAYTARNLDPGTYSFRLKQIDYDGLFEYSPEVEVIVGMPGTYALSSVYPNPFNPQANFALSVNQTQLVNIVVLDVVGREVSTIYSGHLEGGASQTFTIDAENLPSGLYLIRVQGDSFVDTLEATLLR